MKELILASQSPRRQELLKKIITDFKVIPSSFDESSLKIKEPYEFARQAALFKAKEVAQKYPQAIVIGADTIVVLGDQILGKPKDKTEAFNMLKSLCNATQEVITGLAVINKENNIEISDYETTKVTMKAASDKQIKHYIETMNPLDKAGSYGIQEMDEIFIDKIEGDYDNVVGLPIAKLKDLLSKFL